MYRSLHSSSPEILINTTNSALQSIASKTAVSILTKDVMAESQKENVAPTRSRRHSQSRRKKQDEIDDEDEISARMLTVLFSEETKKRSAASTPRSSSNTVPSRYRNPPSTKPRRSTTPTQPHQLQRGAIGTPSAVVVPSKLHTSLTSSTTQDRKKLTTGGTSHLHTHTHSSATGTRSSSKTLKKKTKPTEPSSRTISKTLQPRLSTSSVGSNKAPVARAASPRLKTEAPKSYPTPIVGGSNAQKKIVKRRRRSGSAPTPPPPQHLPGHNVIPFSAQSNIVSGLTGIRHRSRSNAPTSPMSAHTPTHRNASTSDLHTYTSDYSAVAMSDDECVYRDRYHGNHTTSRSHKVYHGSSRDIGTKVKSISAQDLMVEDFEDSVEFVSDMDPLLNMRMTSSGSLGDIGERHASQGSLVAVDHYKDEQQERSMVCVSPYTGDNYTIANYGSVSANSVTPVSPGKSNTRLTSTNLTAHNKISHDNNAPMATDNSKPRAQPKTYTASCDVIRNHYLNESLEADEDLVYATAVGKLSRDDRPQADTPRFSSGKVTYRGRDRERRMSQTEHPHSPPQLGSPSKSIMPSATLQNSPIRRAESPMPPEARSEYRASLLSYHLNERDRDKHYISNELNMTDQDYEEDIAAATGKYGETTHKDGFYFPMKTITLDNGWTETHAEQRWVAPSSIPASFPQMQPRFSSVDGPTEFQRHQKWLNTQIDMLWSMVPDYIKTDDCERFMQSPQDDLDDSDGISATATIDFVEEAFRRFDACKKFNHLPTYNLFYTLFDNLLLVGKHLSEILQYKYMHNIVECMQYDPKLNAKLTDWSLHRDVLPRQRKHQPIDLSPHLVELVDTAVLLQYMKDRVIPCVCDDTRYMEFNLHLSRCKVQLVEFILECKKILSKLFGVLQDGQSDELEKMQCLKFLQELLELQKSEFQENSNSRNFWRTLLITHRLVPTLASLMEKKNGIGLKQACVDVCAYLIDDECRKHLQLHLLCNPAFIHSLVAIFNNNTCTVQLALQLQSLLPMLMVNPQKEVLPFFYSSCEAILRQWLILFNTNKKSIAAQMDISILNAFLEMLSLSIHHHWHTFGVQYTNCVTKLLSVIAVLWKRDDTPMSTLVACNKGILSVLHLQNKSLYTVLIEHDVFKHLISGYNDSQNNIGTSSTLTLLHTILQLNIPCLIEHIYALWAHPPTSGRKKKGKQTAARTADADELPFLQSLFFERIQQGFEDPVFSDADDASQLM